MGALIFYTAIFFIGYFAAHFLNQITGRVLFQNRRIAGLALTLLVGTLHGYKIITSSLPHDHENKAVYALGLYVILPIVIIGVAMLYLI
ncbi:MAG TPA: hypothetical protein VFI43_07590 [Nitrosospira sp.]|nr:hypothetical protein [Nitrosospira sp.]